MFAFLKEGANSKGDNFSFLGRKQFATVQFYKGQALNLSQLISSVHGEIRISKLHLATGLWVTT
jgi:hypothetical protein